MKIVYISALCYADCDFPLVREWKLMGHEVSLFMYLPNYALCGSIINIKKQQDVDGIIPAYSYEEFLMFKEYLGIDDFYVLNQTHKSVFHPHNIKNQISLLKFLDTHKPDVIFSPLIPDTFGCLIYKYRKKYVQLVHDPFPHSGESSYRDTIFRDLAFKIVPKFVILNNSQRKEFIDYWNLKESQVLNNRLGAYNCTKLFLHDEKKKNENFNVLFYGRISPYKGIEYLCEAMLKLHDRYPNVSLTIAGSGTFYFDISKYEKMPFIHIENRYISTEEIASLLNNCSVNVLPYTDATQSGVVLTSYAFNKPVIATNVGGMAEYVIDGKTGILLPPKNVEALVGALVDLIEHKDKLIDMENNIKSYNDGDSSWREIALKYINFFKQDV